MRASTQSTVMMQELQKAIFTHGLGSSCIKQYHRLVQKVLGRTGDFSSIKKKGIV